MSWPYPNPMRMLPSLLYTLAKELQYTYGRAVATTTGSWTGAEAIVVDTDYWALPVDSTLGFPDSGYIYVLGRRWYYGSKSTTEFNVLAGLEPPPWFIVPKGTVITLEVTAP